MRAELPGLSSYNRYLELLPRCAAALAGLFETLKGGMASISIIDSIPIAACYNVRIKCHRGFKGVAQYVDKGCLSKN